MPPHPPARSPPLPAGVGSGPSSRRPGPRRTPRARPGGRRPPRRLRRHSEVDQRRGVEVPEPVISTDRPPDQRPSGHPLGQGRVVVGWEQRACTSHGGSRRLRSHPLRLTSVVVSDREDLEDPSGNGECPGTGQGIRLAARFPHAARATYAHGPRDQHHRAATFTEAITPACTPKSIRPRRVGLQEPRRRQSPQQPPGSARTSRVAAFRAARSRSSG